MFILIIKFILFVIVPTFPSTGLAVLGLGDIFLSGLLSIQTAKKYGKKFGILSVVSVTVALLLGPTIIRLNNNVTSFPATVFVVSGWLTAVGLFFAEA